VHLQRNKIAHSDSLTLTQKETDDVFDCLMDLVKDKDAKCYINQNECINELANLRRRDDVLVILHELQNESNYTKDNVKTIMNILDEQQEERRKTAECRKRAERFWNTLFICFFVFIVPCLAFACGIYNGSDKDTKVYTFNNCISEEFVSPFYQDLPLLGYMENHEYLVGRQWLFEEIRTELDYGDKKALILTADMGYGKSAIFKQIICASEDASALWIKHHVIAFHACWFDVRSTRSPARFVRRLAGFLMTRLPGFKDVFHTLVPKQGLIYETTKCNEDIEACFDQSILLPLDKM